MPIFVEVPFILFLLHRPDFSKLLRRATWYIYQLSKIKDTYQKNGHLEGACSNIKVTQSSLIGQN
jgi:uncharacterized protein (DUF1919 family)